VSSLKCDRWQRLNLESRLTTVYTASGILMFQATWAVSRPWTVACWAAGLLLARPRTPDGRAGGGPAYRAAAWLGTRETKLV